MAEQTQGVIEAARAAAPVQGGQPASVPDATPVQPTPQQPQGFGGQQSVNGFVAQAPATTVEPVVTTPVQPIATDNDRTKQQFEKLTENNQRLSQANELLRQQLEQQTTSRQQSNQQFASVQQVPATQQPAAMPKLSDYIEVDANGERFVNEAKFNAAVADIYQKASRAEEVVTNYVQTAQQREVERQEREAFSAYPQLNPRGGEFDPRLAQQTRAIVYDSLVNPQDYGGRPLDFKAAADYVSKGNGTQVSTPTPAVSTPAVNEENQVQKEQAAFAAQSTPQQVSQNIDAEQEHQRQVMGTRLGSDEAIAVRLLNSVHRAEDVEQGKN